MRFKHPKDGDCTEWKVKFAWLPFSYYNNDEDRWYTVWLERYLRRGIVKEKERPTKFGYSILYPEWVYEKKVIEAVDNKK